jgi:hypothetical protein
MRFLNHLDVFLHGISSSVPDADIQYYSAVAVTVP